MPNEAKEETKDEAKEEAKETNEPVEEWKTSKARDYLFNLCLDPSFPAKDEIRPKQVWEDEPWKVKDVPEFKDFQDYSKFAERLRKARERASKKTDRAKEDAEREETTALI